MKLNSLPSKLAIGGFSLFAIGFLVKTLAFTTPPPAVEIENSPLLKNKQTSNIALALSVEWPTSGQAYPDASYIDGKEYIGYFNPNLCYDYPGYTVSNPRTTASFVSSADYFTSTGPTNTSRYCNQAGTGAGFSGNYLNYVSMSAMDILRIALTGGYRDIDTADLTVLQRTTLDEVGNNANNRTFSSGFYFGYKELSASLVTKVTPFTFNGKVFSASCLDRLHFGTSKTTGPNTNNCNSPGNSQNLNPIVTTGGTTQYAMMKPRVKVCDAADAANRPDFCLPYPNGKFKPVGELQKKADSVRVATFGYLLDGSSSRHGGVLRAPMKYLGPNKLNSTGVTESNSEKEWDETTGVFTVTPVPSAGATASTYTGVVNYLNRFGITGKYKQNDPVGELYYEALRYLQGLQPTPQAVSTPITALMQDGSPYYSSWIDPIENACQRKNYIMAIGDVNVWYDRSLPGAGAAATAQDSANTDANDGVGDFVRPTVLIPGTSQELDSKYWTKLVSDFETGTNTSYVDILGNTRNTLGNPNPRPGLTNLDTTNTGAVQGSYNWAGLAYWANTRPIREDIKDGKSMKDIRVRTFTVDVDEGGNGDIEDTNPRYIRKPRNSSFYLAGKYGFFRDSNLDGNPYKSTVSASSNTEWTGGSAGDLPIGYVLASQAQRLLDAVKSFFDQTSKESGTISVSAVSSSRFTAASVNGSKFAARFNTSDWSGTVLKTTLSLDATTGVLSENPVPNWDAGLVLTQGSTLPATATPTGGQIRPDNRKIFTSVGATVLTATTFTVAGLGANIPASFSTTAVVGTSSVPISNTLMLSYLRGNRNLELGNPNGVFRRRNSILGDIVNSGPVYKKEANTKRSGTGYKAFSNTANSRTGAVYVGAGDGMLHAFREADAKELFAYIPNALLDSLPVLASPTYERRAFVDAVPAVDEVQIGGAWKTILASGMGGGARGVFALDVTDPDNFSKDNVLFEFTNKNDADMGNVVGAPQLVKMRTAGSIPATYKWYVAVTSGYNNYRINASPSSTTGNQALFLLSVDKTLGEAWVLGDNYFKMSTPVGDATKANGMSQPGMLFGEADEVTTFYTGDLQGNVWKFAFPNGLSSTAAAAAVKVNGSGAKIPLFTAYAADGTTRQPITVAPVPQPVGVSGYMLTFGTGKFLEETDSASTAVQTMYGVWDDGGTTVASYNKLRADLYQRTASVGTSTINISTGTFSLGATTATKRGWYFDLPESRERVAVEGTPGTGFVQFNSTIPGGGCDGDGYSNGYILNFADGTAATTLNRDVNSGFRGKPIILDIEIDANYTGRDVLGRRTAFIDQKTVSAGTKNGADGTNITASVKLQYGRNGLGGAGRLNWREIKDFNGAVGN